jgi:hypothetical protein
MEATFGTLKDKMKQGVSQSRGKTIKKQKQTKKGLRYSC